MASFFLNFPEGEYLHDSTLPLEGSQTFQNGAQAKLPVVHTPAEEEFTSKTIVGLFGFRHTRTRTRNGIFLENFFSFSISANPFSSGFSALEKSKCFFLCFVSFGHNLAHKSFKKQSKATVARLGKKTTTTTTAIHYFLVLRHSVCPSAAHCTSPTLTLFFCAFLMV